jgi:stage III sporulation protein AB
MLKISGAILCVLGCYGFGFLKIYGWKKDLEHLQNWLLLFQRIKSRIFYQKEPLEESCIWIGEKEEEKNGVLLLQIGMRARAQRNKEFAAIWKEELSEWCKENIQEKAIREILLQFPDYVKEADEQLQVDLFSFYIEELQREKEKVRNRIQEKEKTVTAVSLALGVMISILLI